MRLSAEDVSAEVETGEFKCAIYESAENECELSKSELRIEPD